MIRRRAATSLAGGLAVRGAVGSCAACAVVLGGAIGFSPVALVAQAGPPSADSVWATPKGRYPAGAIHRLLLSSGHRELWATPIRVEVLDLGSFGGGLTPDTIGGGQQTRSLRFKAANGREYAFRSIDKEAGRTLDPELRASIAARVLQDQIGSMLPVAALVVAPLLEAAGVLYAEPRLVVMPDDPRLGQYRADFAGLLGTIEERPGEEADAVPGFAGADSVVSSDDFLDAMEASSRNRLDEESFIRARLLDAFVGDWDRHPDQWRWAAFRMGDSTVWRPIPRDRDWALANMNGLVIQLIPFGFPQYIGFGRSYPSAFRLTWSGRRLDRELLTGTSRETWDAVAADLQRRLTDDVIRDAVRRMPPEYYARTGAAMTDALMRRRDDLPAFAREFYNLLAGQVDIRASDERDLVEVVRMDSGFTRVEMTSGVGAASARGEPYFRRVFDPRETNDIRVFLLGGADHAAVIGSGDGPDIHIIGGGGDDALIDRTRGKDVHFYDDRGQNRLERAPGTSFDDSSWEQPMDLSSETQQARARDWGVRWVPAPVISYDTDLGVLIGAGMVRYGYGFRAFPYASRFSTSLAYGTGAGRFRANVDYDFALTERTWRGILHAGYSGAEVDRFFGFGNETEDVRDKQFYEAQRSQMNLEAHGVAQLGNVSISAGPEVVIVRPFDNPGTLVDTVQPYGYGDFEQLGVSARIVWDGRDDPRAATRGAYLLLRSRFFPSALDVQETYGGVNGQAAVYFGTQSGRRPTLALRVGGEKLWGDYPYFDAAYIGGRRSVRGFPSRRFAGDASLFGNAELRLSLFRHGLLFPGRVGVLGLADAGRVFFEGEESDKWHPAAGGGLWISFIEPGNAFNVTVARSAERTGVYLGFGFAF